MTSPKIYHSGVCSDIFESCKEELEVIENEIINIKSRLYFSHSMDKKLSRLTARHMIVSLCKQGAVVAFRPKPTKQEIKDGEVQEFKLWNPSFEWDWDNYNYIVTTMPDGTVIY